MQAVIDELGGEKIDIILWNDDVAKFIASALSPAKVLRVTVKEAKKEAEVLVPEDQLSLAIGKKGQNVRLAAKLTGWKIDIIGAKAEGEEKVEVEETNKLEEEVKVEEPASVGTEPEKTEAVEAETEKETAATAENKEKEKKPKAKKKTAKKKGE